MKKNQNLKIQTRYFKHEGTSFKLSLDCSKKGSLSGEKCHGKLNGQSDPIELKPKTLLVDQRRPNSGRATVQLASRNGLRVIVRIYKSGVPIGDKELTLSGSVEHRFFSEASDRFELDGGVDEPLVINGIQFGRFAALELKISCDP